ncbi:hypothetical protein [Planotetraspora kaengkrachanensis]|uniref:Uncharacterized protein n=1 Tax=Planotetraspora kaengkrachanensis TaxID=575193 RepID=A0A8J3M514_9ACTN|nr:hypothetical protein [Planotetraspora kaengkrachanensis]GIG79599.1 hypothetical protein Pka01_27260 [Planotetraspora kaengkrachanensis]
MSNGIRLLISGVAGVATIFLTIFVFELAGSLHWASPANSIPGLAGIILGVVAFQQCRKTLARSFAPDELVRESRRLK